MDTLSTLTRVTACGAGALAITTLMSCSFVLSTSTVPSATTAQAPLQAAAPAPSHSRHFAFARSGPAVLVD
jgi:hypothetical protein